MSTARCDVWAVALWRHYLPSIASGAPFYLAADGRLIRELYVTKLGGQGGLEAGLRDFHAACLTLLDTTGTRTVVCRGAWQRIPGEACSRVICLALQQVLVVERMLHDVQYSEHSYFPRYREMLGLSDPREHSSPLASEVFQEIWDVLARELRAVPGAGTRAVTFVAGKGRDLNRSLPLSQALFTAHDLTIIREECPTLDERTAERVLLTALLRVRGELGGRARKLLTAAATDEVVANRLFEQVRSFLANDVLASLRSSRAVGSATGTIVAYLERADAFNIDSEEDSFSVYQRSENDQSAGVALEEAVGRRLSAAPVVFLVPDADGFREWSREDPLDEADSVLAIVEASKSHLLETQVAQSYGATFVAAKSNLSARFALLVCGSGIGPHISALLGLREPAKRIELVGGLLADARSRIFLAGYPPDGIRYDGRVLGGEETLLVGGVHRHVHEFLDALRNQADGSRYTIQFGDAALSLSVASRKQSSTSPPLGYPLHDGELDLVARPVEGDQPALRGTHFIDAFNQQSVRLAPGDIATLMHRGKRFSVCEADLVLILAELRLFEKANGLAGLAARQIAITRSIPLKAATSGLLRRFQVVREESAGKAT